MALGCVPIAIIAVFISCSCQGGEHFMALGHVPIVLLSQYLLCSFRVPIRGEHFMALGWMVGRDSFAQVLNSKLTNNCQC